MSMTIVGLYLCVCVGVDRAEACFLNIHVAIRIDLFLNKQILYGV